MIFVCTGTQVYQFDRLIKKMDELVSKGIIDNVFAQIGNSTYIPQNYQYTKFLSSNEFDQYLENADLIISHGGTGALIGASKKGKNIIAVPRLCQYGEHVDDHQLQIVGVLEKEGYVRAVYDMEDMEDKIEEALQYPILKKYNRPSRVLEILRRYIEHYEKGIRK